MLSCGRRWGLSHDRGPDPNVIVRSELLRGQDGSWQIQTLWRDLAALRAVRDAGQLPSALAVMERLGAPDSQTHLFVEHRPRNDDI